LILLFSPFFALFFAFSFLPKAKKSAKKEKAKKNDKKKETLLFFLALFYFPKDAMYITNLVGLLLIQQRSQKGFVLLLLSI
jgi:preprotein translocase subunit SecG